MKHMPLSRSSAEKRARSAQIAFAVLGIGAIAVVALALPRLTAVPTLDEVRPKPPAAPQASGPAAKPEEKLAINSQGISDRLMQLGNRPQAPETPTSTGEEPPIDPPVAPPPADAPRFLGVIRESGRFLAMVHVGGKQRIMAEGEEAAGVRVEAIGVDSITISESGVEKTLEKSPRSGGSVSMLGSPGSGGSGGVNAGSFNNSSPVAPGAAAYDIKRMQVDTQMNASEAGQINAAVERMNMSKGAHPRPTMPAIPVAGGGRARTPARTPPKDN